MGRTLNKLHLPGETIGIIGGGQLGQMMAVSAKEKGYKVIILDPTPNCPAAQVSDKQIIAKYSDLRALKEIASEVDVLTYEFENVDARTIDEIKELTDIPQGTKSLIVTQNRIREKDFLSSNDFPVVPHSIINSKLQFENELKKLNYPVILKTIEGGYDGKGQLLIENDGFDSKIVDKMLDSGTCILESKIKLKKEVSVVISSNSNKEHSIFPVIENEHRNNILNISNCPARVDDSIKENAYEIAKKIAIKLDLVGTMCIEFFISDKNKLYVNEIAPRPHNSGHLTIESCNVSQFDAHIRGICNWPMPKIELFSSAVMVNILGQHLLPAKKQISNHNEWYFHDYGKQEIKKNRKMGHVTVLTSIIEQTIKDFKENPIWRVNMGNQLLYSGKAKDIFSTENESEILMVYKDQATALNGVRKEHISGKGDLNCKISTLIFEYLANNGVETHLIKNLSDHEQLVKKTQLIPIEVVLRNRIAGSFEKKFALEKGKKLDPPVIEFYFKSDELNDPAINESQIEAIGIASADELKHIKKKTTIINCLLKKLFNDDGLDLIDFKLEFGRIDNKIILIDEFSPDNCRLWDQISHKSLDKDVFRKNEADLATTYEKVLIRLEGAN